MPAASGPLDILTRSAAESDALSRPGSEPLPSAVVEPGAPVFVPDTTDGGSTFGKFIRRYVLALAVLFLVGIGGVALFAWLADDTGDEPPTTGEFADTEVPLGEVPGLEEFGFGDRSLTINGPLQVNDTFVLTPQIQPEQATAGQLYFDQDTNILNYYNGTDFVELQGGGTAGGDTTNVTNIVNNTSSGSTGTVTSSGGTPGRLAKFTEAQNLEDSLLSESGATVTVHGGLNIQARVGIGTAAPQRPLHIVTNNATTDAPTLMIEQNGSGDSSLEFKTANNKSFFVGMDASGGSSFNIASSTSAAATIDAGQGDENCCNSTTSGTNIIWATRVTVGGTGGTLSSISVYTSLLDATFQGAQVALYTDSGGAPDDPITTSIEQQLTVGWNIFPMTGSVSANTTYWLAFHFEGNSIRRFGPGTHLNVYNVPYGSWPNLEGVAPAFDNPGVTTPMYMTIVPTGAVDSFDGINVLSVTEAGATTLQNATDSGGAFRVLNADGVPQFTVDTANERVYIGNPSADTTGALLVLDTKSDAGDPTGALGGMYYNAARGKMRCFELDQGTDGYWRDCIESARTSYEYANEMLTRASDNVTEIFGTTSQQAGETGHPGIVRFTAAAIGDDAGAEGLGNAADAADNILLGNGDIWRYETVTRVDDLSTGGERYTYRAGFNDDVVNNEDGADGCYFRYSDDINGGDWEGVCRSNSTETVCDTNIAVAADTWYRLTVVVTNSVATFQTNGTSRCTINSNLPVGVGRQTTFMNAIKKEVGATARNADTDYIWITSEFATSR